METDSAKYLPTPEEIARGTAKLRKKHLRIMCKAKMVNRKHSLYTIPICRVSFDRVEGLVVDPIGES